MTAAPFQPQSVKALKGSGKSVVIPTHEFAGDLDERLEFPPHWMFVSWKWPALWETELLEQCTKLRIAPQ